MLWRGCTTSSYGRDSTGRRRLGSTRSSTNRNFFRSILFGTSPRLPSCSGNTRATLKPPQPTDECWWDRTRGASGCAASYRVLACGFGVSQPGRTLRLVAARHRHYSLVIVDCREKLEIARALDAYVHDSDREHIGHSRSAASLTIRTVRTTRAQVEL